MFGIYMTKDQVLRGRDFITMDDFDNWETICTKNNALFCHAFYDEGNVVLDRFNMKLTDELAMSLREFCVKQFDTNAISINSDYDDDIFHYNLDPDDETYSEEPVNESEQVEAPEQETEIEQTEIKEEREVINEAAIADNTIGNYTFHFVWEGENRVHENQTYQQAIAKYQHSVMKNVTCRVMRGKQEIAHYTAIVDTPVVQAVVEKPAPYVSKHAAKAVSGHTGAAKVDQTPKPGSICFMYRRNHEDWKMRQCDNRTEAERLMARKLHAGFECQIL